MTSTASPAGRWLATGCCLVALTGCAITKPASTVPPTGWPDPPASASPTALPAGTPTPATPSQQFIEVKGVGIPVPEGYADASALLEAPADGSARVLAFLRNDAGHAITVLARGTDYTELAAFLDFYVPALNAGGDQEVTSRKTATVGGQPGAELSLTSGADQHTGVLFVTLRDGTLYLINGDTPDAQATAAITEVATGLRLP